MIYTLRVELLQIVSKDFKVTQLIIKVINKVLKENIAL